jgi:predicted nucleic acid-binding protein
MIVVSNAGPIIALARISRLSLLQDYFDQIYISPGTYDELVVKGKGKPGSTDVRTSEWIIRQQVKDSRAVDILLLDLDRGESESIVLAQEIKADVVLLDDLIAREVARSLELRVNGSIGVLVNATKDGKIRKLEPILNDLRSKGVWLSNELCNEALRLAGERELATH